MLTACSCFRKMYKHYEGIMESDNPDRSGKHICKAFPNGIPDEIFSGRNDHSVPMPAQESVEVYEHAGNYSEMEMFRPKRGF